MTKVKICGITNAIEAQIAFRARAWAIGEVFAQSKRQITPEAAARINYALKATPLVKVGVFVNEEISNLKYTAKACLLDMVQLHGHEPPEYVEELDLPVIKAFPVSSPEDIERAYQYKPWAYLFDTKIEGQWGGTGIPFNWQWLSKFPSRRVILAGGLNPHNVKEAVRIVRPMAVDVSSGVEFTRGGKDPEKIIHFIKSVKEADQIVSQ